VLTGKGRQQSARKGEGVTVGTGWNDRN
jgi:hypothetical protein